MITAGHRYVMKIRLMASLTSLNCVHKGIFLAPAFMYIITYVIKANAIDINNKSRFLAIIAEVINGISKNNIAKNANKAALRTCYIEEVLAACPERGFQGEKMKNLTKI